MSGGRGSERCGGSDVHPFLFCRGLDAADDFLRLWTHAQKQQQQQQQQFQQQLQEQMQQQQQVIQQLAQQLQRLQQ